MDMPVQPQVRLVHERLEIGADKCRIEEVAGIAGVNRAWMRARGA